MKTLNFETTAEARSALRAIHTRKKNINVFEKEGLQNTVDALTKDFKKRYLVTVSKEYLADSEDEARDMFLKDAEGLAKYAAEVEKISEIPF